MTRRLVLLCHANLARSPSAELIGDDLVGGSSRWSITSAGTHAHIGQRIDPVIGDALRARGIAVSSHRGRQADGRMLGVADLILTFDGVQRDWVAQHVPSSLRATTTIRRAARWAREAPGADILGLVAADSARFTSADDFDDPYGKGPAVAARAVAEIDTLLRIVLPAIGAIGGDALPPRATTRPTRQALRRTPGVSAVFE